MTVKILSGDCRAILPTLPADSVHCCVTSPPYFGLRDYGTGTWEGGDPRCTHIFESDAGTTSQRDGRSYQQGHPHRDCKCGATRTDSQIGLEPTPDAYVAELVSVFREVRRVLRPDGTLWLNLGDSYTSGGRDNYGTFAADSKQASHSAIKSSRRPAQPPGLKPKDLIGIPWMVAFALRADGWYLRQDIIWAKPNPMPESVTDRCTKAHEYLFLLSKSARYHFDAEAIAEPTSDKTQWTYPQPDKAARAGITTNGTGASSLRADPGSGLRNRRSVWTIPTQGFPGAHFATFPPALVEPCIKAGTSEKGCCAKCGAPWVREIEISEADKETTRGQQPWTAVTGQRDSAGGLPHRPRTTIGFAPSCGCNAATVPCTVLDPFGGAGTVALAADRLGRDAVLIELNQQYAEMARGRFVKDAGMFAEIEE